MGHKLRRTINLLFLLLAVCSTLALQTFVDVSQLKLHAGRASLQVLHVILNGLSTDNDRQVFILWPQKMESKNSSSDRRLWQTSIHSLTTEIDKQVFILPSHKMRSRYLSSDHREWRASIKFYPLTTENDRQVIIFWLQKMTGKFSFFDRKWQERKSIYPLTAEKDEVIFCGQRMNTCVSFSLVVIWLQKKDKQMFVLWPQRMTSSCSFSHHRKREIIIHPLTTEIDKQVFILWPKKMTSKYPSSDHSQWQASIY